MSAGMRKFRDGRRPGLPTRRRRSDVGRRARRVVLGAASGRPPIRVCSDRRVATVILCARTSTVLWGSRQYYYYYYYCRHYYCIPSATTIRGRSEPLPAVDASNGVVFVLHLNKRNAYTIPVVEFGDDSHRPCRIVESFPCASRFRF